MRLLLINYEYPPIGGGAGNATMFMARALLELGHRPTVLTAALAGHAGVRDEMGVTVHRLPVHRARADRASLLEMASFTRAALRVGPDVATKSGAEAVIVFFTLPCGPVALKIQRLAGLPYIVSLRGGDVPGFVPEVSWQHRFLAPWRRRVLRSARTIVANDEGLARMSKAADPFPVKVIPNGVDTSFYRPAADRARRSDSGDRPAPTEVLFVGRFHRQKNLPILLEQMARLHAADAGGWRLSLAGDGPERPALEDSVRRLDLSPIVRWLGWQKDKNQLLALYQQADVVVNPSSYEGMPNVVLEAMGCGIPVVASDVPGNSTLVSPGNTGFLFATDNGDALRTALQTIRDQPELARTLGKNARKRVQSDFTWERVAQSYLELISG